MNKLYLSSVLLIALTGAAQSPANDRDSVIVGKFIDDYIIIDTTDNLYGKRLAEGLKGDSCIVLKYIKSNYGNEWVKVITNDTIGFVMLEFISLGKDDISKLKNDRYPNTREKKSFQFMLENKTDWLAKREENRTALLNKRKQDLEDFKKYTAKNHFFIISHSYPTDEYLKFPGFKVSFVNCKENKIIKYCWFTISAYNPVNDIVGTKIVEAIGPAEPFKVVSYSFDNIFASKVIDYCKIVSIKIQYMDGSITLYNKSQIDGLLLKSDVFLNYLNTLSNN